ncbi:MAG: hypothetical protein ACKO0Z_28010 [Betaproteobacteria bacterium]
MHKWPDGTPKSMHNAFNWRANALGVLGVKFTAPTPARSKDMHSNGSIYSYAKAKSNTAPHVATKHGKGKMFTINKETP